MSRRTRRAAPAPGVARPIVTVCRGCCRGTPEAPGPDRTARPRALRRALDGTATVRVTDCLGACERADVVVVQPSAEGRGSGGRPVRLGLVDDPDTTAGIVTWVRDGGPGLAERPGILDLRAFRPSRRVRAEPHEE
ncbi:(2Fe-2S) ferredoxin domain-containing protein [Streptomyces griseoflavus]|uniref:(2Fe-2S) ferredoxin domain-containing protein n=1 Tax=Streptomyces griseoflavus TaxID=35619 RepID=UPI0038032656